MQGVIDYRQVNLHDATWWKRWRYLVGAMEEVNTERTLQHAFDFQLALVSNPRISADDFKKTQEVAQDLFSKLDAVARPWAAAFAAEQQAAEGKTFKEQWLAMSGIDLDDPEAKAAWAASVAAVYKEQEDAPQRDAHAAQLAIRAFSDKVAAIAQKRRTQQGRK